MAHMKTIGSRAEVWHGTAIRTSGGLRKQDLIMNKNGRIVSRKKHTTAKNENRLVKYGYGAKKGKFGYVKLTTSSSIKRRKSHFRKNKSRRMSRGGEVKPFSQPSTAASY